MNSRKLTLLGRCRWSGMLLAGLLAAAVPASRAADEPKLPDPARFQARIDEYVAHDAKAAPPPNAIVVVGSSSIVGWHEHIVEDLAPLTVIPRGFGGSNMRDLLHFVKPLVLDCRPRAVVVYEGDNDLGGGVAPEQFARECGELAGIVHRELPECRVYFLSIKPSIRRWAIWPKMQEANRLVAAMCAADPLLTYIDVASPMLEANGQPRADIFKEDKLHMLRSGYLLWREAVRAVLVKAEERYER